jgi:phage protein D
MAGELQVLDPYAARPTDLEARQVLDPYPNARTARHVELAVSWETKNITRDLAPHLDGIVYVDNLSGNADEFSLELEDRDGLWSGDWRPAFGDQVVARLKYADAWFGQKVTELRLGTFAHDKISLSKPPNRVSVQCISAALATALRRRKRTRSWNGVTLKQIAQDIAKRAELTLNYDGPPGTPYKHTAQNNKSDLEFLEDLCKKVGRTVKVTEGTIAIFEEHALDGRATSGDIDLIGGNVESCSFEAADGERYGACHITCFNPYTGKEIQYTFPPTGTTIPGLDPNGQTLELKIEVSDAAEAKVRAEKLLRLANKFAVNGRLVTVGDPGLVAGVTFNLTNAFSLDGKFIITRAEHRTVGAYTCTLDVRRCLEGY